jgi:hypothetical protein
VCQNQRDIVVSSRSSFGSALLYQALKYNWFELEVHWDIFGKSRFWIRLM